MFNSLVLEKMQTMFLIGFLFLGSFSVSSAQSGNDDILSRDYSTAQRALSHAIAKGDRTVLRRGLKSQLFSIKLAVVTAVAETTDQTFVQTLLETLQNNQAIFSGGTETEALQNDLNFELIVALAKLTGMRLNVSRSVSRQQIKQAIQKSSSWHQRNRKRLNL